MKRTLLILLLLLNVLTYAQVSRSVLDTTKQYRNISTPTLGSWYRTTSVIEITNEELLYEDKVYKKVITSSFRETEDIKDLSNWSYLREEDNVVYMYCGNEEVVVYNFNLNVGDTITIPTLRDGLLLTTIHFDNPSICSLQVLSVDSIDLQGEELKRLELRDLNEGRIVEWIEGLGDVTYGFLSTGSYKLQYPFDGFLFAETTFLCVIQDNDCIYNSGISPDCFYFEDCNISNVDAMEISIYPTIVNDELFINCNRDYNIRIFDVYGNKVYTCFESKDVINLSKFISGFYLVELFKDNEIIYKQKVLKI